MLKRIARILVIPLVILIYVVTLILIRHESAERSLRIVQHATEPDHVLVEVKISGVDLVGSETKARLIFRLAGTIAKDEVTPAVDLKLLLNTSRGEQEYNFPAGRRINPIEALFTLTGDLTSYPFDRHHVSVWMLIAKPAVVGPALNQAGPSQTSPSLSSFETVPAGDEDKQQSVPVSEGVVGEQSQPATSDIVVGAAAQENHKPVPIYVDLTASVPAIRFTGAISGHAGRGDTRINLEIRRAKNVIRVSVAVMILMMCLAMSLLAMVVRVTSTPAGKEALLPLSLSVSLIFGLPALRQIQPGVPPVGALGDYFSFIWAELIVAASTVIVVWTWIVKSRRKNEHTHET